MVKMKKYLWLALYVVSLNAFSDGIDHDKNFYGKDVKMKPDEITVWKEINGSHFKELPREQLPNGHFMLNPHNRNYWRDFDEWPCHYPIWPNDGKQCINPGDRYRKHHIDIDEHEHDHEHNHDNTVPEPEIMLMLGIGFVWFKIRYL